MTALKLALLKGLTYLKTIGYGWQIRQVPQQFEHHNVPYFSQWESGELAKQLLLGEIKAEDDPKWRESGAVSKAEYAAWSWNGCGMVCLKMILAHRNHTVIPLVVLGKKCAEYGGYDMPLASSKGLRYKPFLRFLKQEFGITAKIAIAMPVAQIVRELARGNYVMASVSPQIRNPATSPRAKGGHIVVVVGYDIRKRELYIHNSSGDSASSQEHAVVTFEDFAKFFSNRGIIIPAVRS